MKRKHERRILLGGVFRIRQREGGAWISMYPRRARVNLIILRRIYGTAGNFQEGESRGI